MKKTLLITLDFPPQTGGVATYLGNFCAQLNPENICVLANRVRQNFLYDEKQKYTIMRKSLLYRFIWPRWLKAYFTAKKIVQQQNISQLLISHVLPIGYVCLLLKLPFIVICHGYDVQLATANPWKEMWFKKIMKKANTIIVNSEYTKKAITDICTLDEDIIRIVAPCPNTLTTEVSEEALSNIKTKLDIQDKNVLLSVGRLVERKGFDTVIRSLPIVIKDNPDILYILVGGGPYQKKLEQLSIKYQVQDYVVFAGRVDDEELPVYYGLSDIFIMPSRIIENKDVEGFGIVFLEANMYGKPVIAGDTGGVRDAVVDGETGILVDPENTQEIANSILSLLKDKALRKTMGQKGKQRVENEFTWDKQVGKVRELFN